MYHRDERTDVKKRLKSKRLSKPGVRSVRAVCKGCEGYGLVPRDDLPADTVAICTSCEGTGWFEVFYQPFGSRRRLNTPGAHYVQLFNYNGAKTTTTTVTEFYAEGACLRKPGESAPRRGPGSPTNSGKTRRKQAPADPRTDK